MVPHAGIEPALLAELDFESSASTNSANGAAAQGTTGGDYTESPPAVNKPGKTPSIKAASRSRV